MTKVKQVKLLSEQTFAVAHKLTYAYEIREEEPANKLIETVLADLKEIIKVHTPVVDP